MVEDRVRDGPARDRRRGAGEAEVDRHTLAALLACGVEFQLTLIVTQKEAEK